MNPACKVCQGRGEVEAGITGGFVKTGQDDAGIPTGYPTRVRPNPNAVYPNGEIWYLETNSLVELWGIAVCAPCRGTGMQR